MVASFIAALIPGEKLYKARSKAAGTALMFGFIALVIFHENIILSCAPSFAWSFGRCTRIFVILITPDRFYKTRWTSDDTTRFFTQLANNRAERIEQLRLEKLHSSNPDDPDAGVVLFPTT